MSLSRALGRILQDLDDAQVASALVGGLAVGVRTEPRFTRGIEPEICDHAERLDVLPGLTLPVAATGHLVAMKLLAVGPERPRDLQDLVHLRRVATARDVALAQQAVATILARPPALSPPSAPQTAPPSAPRCR